ncbi:MAG: hypothetical protein GY934_07300 [Gammaproteobacteria bacterium]|nr:hypothetical protein [Gammaproteobacteria bacterium]
MNFGFSARLYQEFTLQAQMHVNEDLDPLYDGLYEAFIRWQPHDKNYNISIGRLDYVYTGLERSTSSNKITTIERGQLVNQLMPNEVVGILARGRYQDLGYQAGLFSGDIEEEFTNFTAGYAAMLGLNYSWPLLFDQGRLHLDYLYNDGHSANNAFKLYQHTTSLWHEASTGPFQLKTDLTIGLGIEDISDVLGITLLPTYDLATGVLSNGDQLQLALRYQYATSRDNNCLQPQKRYEQYVTSGAGNRYMAFYTGLNYYPYKKFKLMVGAEIAEMKDKASDGGEYRGWNYFAGIRLYF